MIASDFIAKAFLISLVTIGTTASHAIAAPQGAMDKTVRVAFVVSGSARKADGSTVSFNNPNSYVIYTSQAGRTFFRGSAQQGQGKRIGRSKDFAPEDQGRANFSYQGNRLVGTFQFASGVRRVSIEFDSGFSSCTASVIDGRSAGGTIRRKSPSGEWIEVLNVSTSTPTCSIQPGNGVAG